VVSCSIAHADVSVLSVGADVAIGREAV